MTSFSETRLELGLTYGANYGPRFSTAINAQANGVEIAEAEWEDPLIQINLPDKAYTRSETEYLLDFHATMKGSLTGFRIRDWSDYFVTGQAIGTGNGTVQDWQLIKTYTVGSYSVKRAITKPVAGSLVVYVNGVVTNSGWSVDTTTGKFTTELTGAISVNFEFDVPVRFVEDKLDFRFDAVQGNNALFTQQPITLTEIRVTPWAYPSLDPFPVSLSHQIDLGYDLGTTGGPEFDTFIAETAGEWESRVARRDNPLGVWNLGDRTLTRSQANYLIALFRIARGRAIPFGYLDYQEETVKLVRFTEDRLGVSFLAHRHSDKQAIFSLAAIGIRAIDGELAMLRFEFDIRADYYGSTPAEDILDGSYGGRNDLPWTREGESGQFVGYTMQVFFDEGYGGGGWYFYFLRVMIDGVNKTPGGVWWRASLAEQKKAFTGIRPGILNPKAVNITAVPV